jgi:predicted nucleic acid-binding protein
LPQVKIEIVKDDPADNNILDCAIAANAEYIGSGDHHLFQLGSYKQIKIINAKQFFEMFLR